MPGLGERERPLGPPEPAKDHRAIPGLQNEHGMPHHFFWSCWWLLESGNQKRNTPQVRRKCLFLCLSWILLAACLQRKPLLWSPQAFAAVSVGSASITSQLLTICYFCSILAFIWRKVTGECSAPVERCACHQSNRVLSEELLPTWKASILL